MFDLYMFYLHVSWNSLNSKYEEDISDVTVNFGTSNQQKLGISK